METQFNSHIHGGTGISSLPISSVRTAAASRARLKHGLYSRDVVIPGESQEEFDAQRAEMKAELRPQGPDERALVEQMVRAQWRLLRLEAAETGVFTAFDLVQPEAATSRALWLAQCFEADCGRERALERLSLLQQRLLNQYLRCGRRLDALREGRRRGMLREAAAIQKRRPEFARDGVVEYEAPAPAPAPAPAASAPAANDPAAPATGPAPDAASPSSDSGTGEYADRGDPLALPLHPVSLRASTLLASEEGIPQPATPALTSASPEDVARLEAEDEHWRRVVKGFETET